MSTPSADALQSQLSKTIGPAPWYWKTFPALRSAAGQRFVWTHHGESGPVAYLVSLALEQEPEKPRLALNTYSRPFLVPPDRLGVWCPEGQNVRLTCFDPDQLKPFDFAEIAGWFKQSSERMYAATPPLEDFEVPASLPEGTHKVDISVEFQTVEELIIPTSCAARTPDDPAMALHVFYLHAGLLEVLPQKWFTANQYQVGKQWITRAARDSESHRIFGECFKRGTFLLAEDGCTLDRWLSR